MYNNIVITSPESGINTDEVSIELNIGIRSFISCFRFFLKNSYGIPSGPGDLLFGNFFTTEMISLGVIGALNIDESVVESPGGVKRENSGGHTFSEE